MNRQSETILGRIKEKSVQLPPKKKINWDEQAIADILQDFLTEYLTGNKEDDDLDVEYTLKIIDFFESEIGKQDKGE